MHFARKGAVRTLAAAAIGFMCAFGASAHSVTVAVGTTFSTLDPYDAPDGMTRICAKSIYEGLFTFDKNLKLVPELAESYSVSPDGLVYTMKLKKGVKFHDGTDFTSAAVKANFDRLLNPENHLGRISIFNFIAKVEAPDPETAVFTLKHPMAGFVRRLATTTPQMICPSYLEKYGKDKKLAQLACGTGPYLFESFSPTEGLRVKKNPNYRVKGLPKLDGIHFIPVVENSTRAAMLRTGEAQFVTPMPLELIKSLQDDPAIVIQTTPSVMSRYLSINTTAAPFNNPKVREAINYAINKEAFCKVAYAGFAVPAEGVMPSMLPGYEKLGPWPYNPQKARELLKEAGYPQGFSTVLWSGYSNSTSAKALQFIQQQLRQVGIKVETKLLEPGVRASDVYGVQNPKDAKHRLYYIGWSDATLDPDFTLRPVLDSRAAPPNFMNTAYYSNPEFDRRLDEAMVETDEAKRAEIYREAQKIVWKDAPWAFLAYEMATAGASRHLKNFTIRADSAFDFYEAEWVD